MKIVEYQIAPGKIRFDERFPDQASHYIYEHLRASYARIGCVPTVTCRTVDDTLVVVRGHKYLRIAQEEGFKSVPIVIEGPPPNAIESIASGCRTIITEQERIPESVTRPFVFFFSGKLTDRAKAEFERLVRERFDAPDLIVNYFADDEAAEFIGRVRIEDRAMASALRGAVLAFNVDGIRIVSQDGLRLEPPEGSAAKQL